MKHPRLLRDIQEAKMYLEQGLYLYYGVAEECMYDDLLCGM
jgi:hypothetical protein